MSLRGFPHRSSMSRRVLAHVLAVVLVVGAGAGAVACGSDSGSDTDDTTLDSGDEVTAPGTRFDVAPGDRFTIVLDSNATTGYSWALETEPDPAVVTPVDDDYISPDDAAPGTGGQQRLTFDAVGPGTATIDLWYLRPFEDPPDPVERASFPVTVAG